MQRTIKKGLSTSIHGHQIDNVLKMSLITDKCEILKQDVISDHFPIKVSISNIKQAKMVMCIKFNKKYANQINKNILKVSRNFAEFMQTRKLCLNKLIKTNPVVNRGISAWKQAILNSIDRSKTVDELSNLLKTDYEIY